MNPLWKLDRTLPAGSPFEPGALHDVVIVGAGITGLSTAVMLTRAGLDVAVIDAGGIDTVQSAVSFNLDASAGVRFVERLTLTGTAAINGTGNAARDGRFAREGAREMQRYEAQRRPLSGGAGVMPPQECPGSNFGVGCAGAHLDPSMRQGATTNVRQDSNKPPDPR